MILTVMAAPCYCCPAIKVQKGDLNDDPASRAELDNALNGLGMLSTVTDSRLEYLREKMKSKSLSSRVSGSEMCVLQMNSDFVTNFTFSRSSSSGYTSGSNSEAFDTDECSRRESRRFCMRLARNRHLYKPYDFSCREKVIHRNGVKRFLFDSVCAISHHNDTTQPNVSSSSTAVVTRQDSGNKSNPGSPVKSQKKVTNTGCSITRSRSLDDLEISKLNLNECCSNGAGKADIEIVSQRINNLHVS